MRDINPNCVNSLVLEPVVLKVVFNTRTWLQVDFVKNGNSQENDAKSNPALTVAVLGPISCTS
ncbi:MAG: hypothetical protein K8F91_24530, partial [Candidatus Obscuribacterales bacterium]|nr:hypothetical protein [Candidatus Obscuribacterales bacterium]